MKNFSFFNKIILFFVCSLAFIGLFGSFNVYAADAFNTVWGYDNGSVCYDRDIWTNEMSLSFYQYENDTWMQVGFSALVPTGETPNISGREYSYYINSSGERVYYYDRDFTYTKSSSTVYIDGQVYDFYYKFDTLQVSNNPYFSSTGNFLESSIRLGSDALIEIYKYVYFGIGSLPDGVIFHGALNSDSNDSSLDLKDLSGMIQSPYKINDYHSQFSNILSDLFGRLNLGFTQNPNYYITPNIQMSWSSPDFYDSDNGFIARDYVHFKIWYSGTFSYYQELFSTISGSPSYTRTYDKLLVYDGSADQQFNHFFNTYRADISSSLDSSFYDMCYGQIEINDLGDALVQMTSIGRNPLDVLSYRIKNDVNYIYIQAYYIDYDDVMHKGAVSYLELTDDGLIVHSGVTNTDDDSSSDIDSGDFDQVVSGNGVDIDNDVNMVSGNEPDQVTDEPNIINNNNNYYTYNYYYDYTDSEQNSNFLEIFWKTFSAVSNMIGKLVSYLKYCFTGSFN